MQKKVFLNFIKYLSVIALMFFCEAMGAFAKENSSVNVESNVSATAKSGGVTISGPGTVKTGDANASVKSINIVNGEEKVEANAKAKAEAGGKGSTASVQVNGEKQTCTAQNENGCKVEMKNENDPVTDMNGGILGEEMTKETADADEETERTLVQSINSLISKVTQNIINWFR